MTISARAFVPTVLGAVASLLLAAALFVVGGAPAAADNCLVISPTGEITYVCEEPGTPGQPGGPGSPGGGTAPPPCDMTAPATFCMGTTPCYYKEVVTPYAPPQTPPPTEDADWRVRMCLSGGSWMGTAVWMDGTQPEPPSLEEQARTAFGALRPPLGALTANPDGRTLVSLDTWFWAQGLGGGELTGSSAFGLVAVATPDYLEINPGDGSASMQCPWVTSRSDVCSHVYQRASAGAHSVTGQPVWSVQFERGGAVLNIPGAPTELRGPTMNVAVDVDEVQAVVTDVR